LALNKAPSECRSASRTWHDTTRPSGPISFTPFTSGSLNPTVAIATSVRAQPSVLNTASGIPLPRVSMRVVTASVRAPSSSSAIRLEKSYPRIESAWTWSVITPAIRSWAWLKIIGSHARHRISSSVAVPNKRSSTPNFSAVVRSFSSARVRCLSSMRLLYVPWKIGFSSPVTMGRSARLAATASKSAGTASRS
jgi:hypothetical protein